jgi:hypothetical protein
VAAVRLFVVDQTDWHELTDGGQQTVRVAAPDLQQARRARARIREADDVTLISASPRQDLRDLARDVLARLASRGHAQAS